MLRNYFFGQQHSIPVFLVNPIIDDESEDLYAGKIIANINPVTGNIEPCELSAYIAFDNRFTFLANAPNIPDCPDSCLDNNYINFSHLGTKKNGLLVLSNIIRDLIDMIENHSDQLENVSIDGQTYIGHKFKIPFTHQVHGEIYDEIFITIAPQTSKAISQLRDIAVTTKMTLLFNDTIRKIRELVLKPN